MKDLNPILFFFDQKTRQRLPYFFILFDLDFVKRFLKVLLLGNISVLELAKLDSVHLLLDHVFIVQLNQNFFVVLLQSRQNMLLFLDHNRALTLERLLS